MKCFTAITACLSLALSNVNAAPVAIPQNTTVSSLDAVDAVDPIGLSARGTWGSIKQATNVPFADPSIFRFGNSQWWAFATTNHKGINVQSALSNDFNSWTVQTYDVLPKVGAWANQADPNVWAPNVVYNDYGFYIMYYSANSAADHSKHCIGVATAANVNGPYTPHDTPLACPLSQGGAIDPSGFKDADGTRYVTYKVDGNSIGHGGLCSNMVAPIVPTPIMLQKVAGDGFTPVGAPVQILDRNDADGPLVEAPALMRTSNGKYVLFFSSSCYNTAGYDIAYAMADSIAGPYAKYGPFAVTGTNGLFAPGGAHVAFDGTSMVFHAGVWPNRYMYTAKISVNTNNHVVSA